ncbi:hypothetical protein [Bernardetia sp.]|uniref:tellurite resistance TerB family protein n=1 Tax=Bernardetia sp. TaxID=1937974 RepID=UPI0025C595C8|nr:hypothetical protein [Bernardetia sp.]
MDNKFEHVLNSCSTKEKLAYLQLIIFIAFSDHHLSDDEATFLDKITEIANLSEEDQQKLAAYSRHPASIDVQLCAQNIARSPLREILLIDLMVIARSDDDVATEERTAITQIAVLLGVPLDEVIRLTNSVNKYQYSESDAPQEWIEQSMISTLYKHTAPTQLKKLSMTRKIKKFLGILKE